MAISVRRTISGLPRASTSMPSMVTSVESTSKKTKRYLDLRVILRRADAEGPSPARSFAVCAAQDDTRASRRLSPHELRQIREPLEKVIGLRRDELLARRRAGRHHRHVDAAVARGADVDGHVA